MRHLRHELPVALRAHRRLRVVRVARLLIRNGREHLGQACLSQLLDDVAVVVLDDLELPPVVPRTEMHLRAGERVLHEGRVPALRLRQRRPAGLRAVRLHHEVMETLVDAVLEGGIDGHLPHVDHAVRRALQTAVLQPRIPLPAGERAKAQRRAGLHARVQHPGGVRRPRRDRRRYPAASVMAGLLDFDHHLDLDHRTERQRGDTEGRARVLPAFAEHRDQQVGAAVHHLGLLLEVVDRVDEAADAYDPLHAGEFSDLRLQGRDQPERRLAGGLVGRGHGGVATDFAGHYRALVVSRNVSGEEHEVSAAHGGDIVGDRLAHRGELRAEGGEPGLGGGGSVGRRQRGGEGSQQDGGEKGAGKVHRITLIS